MPERMTTEDKERAQELREKFERPSWEWTTLDGDVMLGVEALWPKLLNEIGQLKEELREAKVTIGKLLNAESARS